MAAGCTCSLRWKARVTGGWTIALLASAALSLSAYTQLCLLRRLARVARTHAGCSPKALIPVQRRKHQDVRRNLRTRTPSKQSRESGLIINALDWRLVI